MTKILVVDYEAELRKSLAELLRLRGFFVEEAKCGEDAVNMAVSENFHIALVDLMMPGMSGLDTLKELKKIRPKMQVIMITAFGTVDSAVDAIKKGACHYILKPFNIENLVAIIRSVLEVARCIKDFIKDIDKLSVNHVLNSLSNPIRREIISLLSSNANMHLMEITKDLNFSDHTKVVFHLKTLMNAGLIEQDKKRTYLLTEVG